MRPQPQECKETLSFAWGDVSHTAMQRPLDERDKVILACLRAGLPVKTITSGTGLARATVLRRVKAIRERVVACRAG